MVRRWWDRDERAFAQLLAAIAAMNEASGASREHDAYRARERAIAAVAAGWAYGIHGAPPDDADAVERFLSEAFANESIELHARDELRKLVIQGAARPVLEAFAHPVLCEVLDRALRRPSTRLAAYGTLRTGESNHHHVADLASIGHGTVRGATTTVDGFPVFRPDVAGEAIACELFWSEHLRAERWAALDAFEGEHYRRILVPVLLADETYGVASIYAAATA